MGCIYLVRNKVNGKGYVGKTIRRFRDRKRMHERDAERGIGFIFQRALRKYGFDAFEWKMVVEEDDEKELNELERLFIKRWNTKAPNGYNLTDGGEGASGWNPSEETRRKIGVAHLGMKHTKEARAKIKAAHLCRMYKSHSEQTKRKISEAQKGRSYEELFGEEEATRKKEKHRKARLGKRLSELTKRKLSRVMQGRVFTEEWREKISQAKRGKKQTLQQRENKSESMREKWKDPKYRRMILEARKIAKEKKC